MVVVVVVAVVAVAAEVVVAAAVAAEVAALVIAVVAVCLHGVLFLLDSKVNLFDEPTDQQEPANTPANHQPTKNTSQRQQANSECIFASTKCCCALFAVIAQFSAICQTRSAARCFGSRYLNVRNKNTWHVFFAQWTETRRFQPELTTKTCDLNKIVMICCTLISDARQPPGNLRADTG